MDSARLRSTGSVPELPAIPELVSEFTRLALESASKGEFRGRALELLARTLRADRGAWQETPPFGELRVEFPAASSGSLQLVPSAPPEGEARAAAEHGATAGRRALFVELERFGRPRATLSLVREGAPFLAEELEWLRALLPTLILADEGTPGRAGPSRALTPRESDIVEYVRLGYTNAQIAMATGRSLAAVRNLLVRIFDKTGVRARAQLVGGPLATSHLTRREREIVQHLRAGLTNREIGRVLGISANTVRNTLARLFEKIGVSTRSELMGVLAGEGARAWPCGAPNW